MTEIWTSAWNARVEEIAQQAHQAEDAGFDGMFITDSQNLWMECWVALTVAATETERLKLGTAVTNPVTRHAAVTADAAASLQEVSKGRVLLGIGRGDSALAYLGHAPASLPRFARYLARTSYDMTRHGETHSSHAASMNDELVDRFGIAGPPDHCIERLRGLMSLGLHRIVFNTRIRGATEEEKADVTHLMLNEVLPNVSGRARDGQPG